MKKTALLFTITYMFINCSVFCNQDINNISFEPIRNEEEIVLKRFPYRIYPQKIMKIDTVVKILIKKYHKNIPKNYFSEVIINSAKEFNSYFINAKFAPFTDYIDFQKIDFNKYTLIAHYLNERPQSIIRKFFRDDKNKKCRYVFNTLMKIEKQNSMLYTSGKFGTFNIALVKKIPKNYIIDFIIINENKKSPNK